MRTIQVLIRLVRQCANERKLPDFRHQLEFEF